MPISLTSSSSPFHHRTSHRFQIQIFLIFLFFTLLSENPEIELISQICYSFTQIEQNIVALLPSRACIHNESEHWRWWTKQPNQ